MRQKYYYFASFVILTLWAPNLIHTRRYLCDVSIIFWLGPKKKTKSALTPCFSAVHMMSIVFVWWRQKLFDQFFLPSLSFPITCLKLFYTLAAHKITSVLTSKSKEFSPQFFYISLYAAANSLSFFKFKNQLPKTGSTPIVVQLFISQVSFPNFC